MNRSLISSILLPLSVRERAITAQRGCPRLKEPCHTLMDAIPMEPALSMMNINLIEPHFL